MTVSAFIAGLAAMLRCARSVMVSPCHSESEAMVVITLPNDESLRGRHLEFWLHAQALVGGMGSVGLYSRVRLNVAKGEARGLERVTPRPARTGKIPARQ